MCRWFYLLNGEEDAAEAVERVVREGINSMEGDSMEGEDVKITKANVA